VKHFISFSKSIWFYSILVLVIFLLINLRQKKITNFDCEICVDKAGYLIFLPAIFHMGFEAAGYPEGFEEKLGIGNTIDREQNKVITKYTYGLSLLWLPYYALAALIAKLFSLQVEPVSYYYLFFINIGAAIYAVVGLLCFRKWLEYHVDSKSSLVTMFALFFGTSLYYYVLDESLMSHLYSFVMLSVGLFSFKSYLGSGISRNFILLCLAVSMAILIRPINVLFVPIIIFQDTRSWKDMLSKISLMLAPRNLLTAMLIFTIIIMSPV